MLMNAMGAIVVAAAMLMAGAKPNFSGEWTLDATRSQFGSVPPPTSVTRKIEHVDPALTVTEVQTGGSQGDRRSMRTYTTDGRASTNDFLSYPVQSTAVWDGDTLVITLKAVDQGVEFKEADRWTLSPDGRVLTSIVHIAAGDGDFDVTYVMNKQ